MSSSKCPKAQATSTQKSKFQIEPNQICQSVTTMLQTPIVATRQRNTSQVNLRNGLKRQLKPLAKIKVLPCFKRNLRPLMKVRQWPLRVKLPRRTLSQLSNLSHPPSLERNTTLTLWFRRIQPLVCWKRPIWSWSGKRLTLSMALEKWTCYSSKKDEQLRLSMLPKISHKSTGKSVKPSFRWSRWSSRRTWGCSRRTQTRRITSSRASSRRSIPTSINPLALAAGCQFQTP